MKTAEELHNELEALKKLVHLPEPFIWVRGVKGSRGAEQTSYTVSISSDNDRNPDFFVIDPVGDDGLPNVLVVSGERSKQ